MGVAPDRRAFGELDDLDHHLRTRAAETVVTLCEASEPGGEASPGTPTLKSAMPAQTTGTCAGRWCVPC